MEFLTTLQEKWNIDMIIFLIVILSGYFQEKYLCKFYWSKDSRFDGALKTLVVSFIASSIYILIVYKEAKIAAVDGKALLPWAKYFISYFTATSIYDMLIRPFRKWITKITGDDQP